MIRLGGGLVFLTIAMVVGPSAAVGQSGRSPAKGRPASPPAYRVVEVLSANTAVLEIGPDKRPTYVSLAGLVPPSQLDPRAFGGPLESAGREALIRLAGQRVRARWTHDPDRPQDGPSAVLFRPAGGPSINQLMLEGGHAAAAVDLLPPDLRTPYQAAETKARRERLGLWAAPGPVARQVQEEESFEVPVQLRKPEPPRPNRSTAPKRKTGMTYQEAIAEFNLRWNLGVQRSRWNAEQQRQFSQWLAAQSMPSSLPAGSVSGPGHLLGPAPPSSLGGSGVHDGPGHFLDPVITGPPAKCAVADCRQRRIHTSRFCLHHVPSSGTGNLDPFPNPTTYGPEPTCQAPGCGRPRAIAYRYCPIHLDIRPDARSLPHFNP